MFLRTYQKNVLATTPISRDVNFPPFRHRPEQFQFETLSVSNHTACRFAEKTRFFRSLRAGRRCAAASRFTFFKDETLYGAVCKTFFILSCDRTALRRAGQPRSNRRRAASPRGKASCIFTAKAERRLVFFGRYVYAP